MKRLFCLLVIVSLFLDSGVNVYAKNTPAPESTASPEETTNPEGTASLEGSVMSDEDLAKEIGVSKENVVKMKSSIIFLKEKGYSDAAIAGMLSNCVQESGWNPLAEQNTTAEKKGGGLYQFTPHTNFSGSRENKKCKHEKGKVFNTQYCADGVCQTTCVDRVLETDGYFKTYGGNVKRYNEMISIYSSGSDSGKFVDTKGKKMDCSFPTSVVEVKDLDGFKSLESPIDAAITFCIIYERCAGTSILYKDTFEDKSRWNKLPPKSNRTYMDWFLGELTLKCRRLKNAETLYTWLGGKGYEKGETKVKGVENKAIAAGALYDSGYWSEEQLESYCKLNQLDIEAIYLDLVTRDDLSQSELESLISWERNIEDSKTNHGVYKWIRMLTMFAGIIMIVWSLFLYLAYWFDRVNPIFDIDMLGLITFNKLHVSDTEEECTFGQEGASRVTVNQRKITIISVIGVAAGTLVVSGLVYRFIAFILNKAFALLGGI